jgi:hypothetical protein
LNPTTANNPSDPDAVDDIIASHDRTKHHPQRYAFGPGGLDWAKIAVTDARYETRVTTLGQINNIRRLGTEQTRCSQAVNRKLCDLAGNGKCVFRE